MGYHADRFSDLSLIALEDGAPIALLPLNRKGQDVWSHQGLTFGGLIIHAPGTARVLEILDACSDYLRAEGASHLVYKTLPIIYAEAPAQEELYWLFRRNAALVRRDVSVAIDYRARGPVSSRRSRGARKAEKAGLTFGQSHNWSGFWRLLETVLASRHDVAPTHSLDEIKHLAARFCDEIALFEAASAGEMQAGVVMFRSAYVAHAQYIAASDAGRETGALDGLFEHLIKLHAQTHRYFDFGISNTDQGRVLNEGLVRQKEEFGGGAIAHDVYRVVL
jgi:hypothetical protein